MIHVATIHHRDDRFVDLQAAALDRHLDEPYQVHTIADQVEVPADWQIVTTRHTTHGPRLDVLAHHILDQADDDDLIVFLDGDAWPVANPIPTIRRAATDGWLLAVRRDEGSGAGWPHPSFCATTVHRWRRLRASWRPTMWPDRTVQHRFDVGVGVLRRLVGRRWTPLLRSNTVNPHPLFFAVYGHLVYHHGAGFRRPFTSRDGRETDGDAAAVRHRLARNRQMSDDWLAAARSSPDFWRSLCA